MTMLRSAALSAAALLLLLAAGPARALDFSLGEVAVENLGDFGFTAADSRLSFDGNTTDELYQLFGYVGNADDHFAIDGSRFDVDSAIAEVGGAGSGRASSTVTLNRRGANALGLSVGAFSVTYDYELVDDTDATDTDHLVWNVTFTNNTASDIALSFYAYLDFDLAGDFGDDEATGTSSAIIVNDAGAADAFAWRPTGVAADHFEIGPYATVRSALDSMRAATDLDDSGSGFGPGDFTGAFQFDVVIPASDALSIGMSLPNVGSSTMLLMGLVGLAVAPRTRQRRRVAGSAARR